jgi:hypothetical protein
MFSALNNVIDLTTDSSPEDNPADEVVVAASQSAPPSTVTNDDSIHGDRSSTSSFGTQATSFASTTRPSSAHSAGSGPSQKRGSHTLPESSAHTADRTPSRTSRRTMPIEIRDSQSPPPPSDPAAPKQDRTPQHPPTRSSRNFRTPNNRTPSKTEWTVDKIVNALTELSEQVHQGHARLVEFLLEEAEKTAPVPRHQSPVDVFANMPSIVVENTPPGVESMSIKFKAGVPLSPSCMFLLPSHC